MKKQIRAIFLSCVLLSNAQCAMGSEEVLLSEMVANSVEQIKKINDQIKLAMDALDQFDRINNTLNSVDKLIFESGEKLFNPASSLKNIVNKAQALKKRFEAYPDKFKNGFGYDRFFKDYHNVTCRTEYTKAEEKEFAELERKTGIKVDTFKVRKCIEENLTKAKTEKQKEALNNAQQALMSNDLEGVLNNVKIFEEERRKKIETLNANLVGTTRELRDLYLTFTQVDENGQTQSQAIQEELKTIANEIQNDKSPDLVGKIANTNALLLKLVDLSNRAYEAQVKFYNAYQTLETALKTKERKTQEDIANIKVEAHDNALIKDLREKAKKLENDKDELGIPKFSFEEIE